MYRKTYKIKARFRKKVAKAGVFEESFSGSLTRLEIGHIRIASDPKGAK